MMLKNNGTAGLCDQLGNQALTYGRRINFSEIDAILDSIDEHKVRSVLMNYVYDKCPVVVGVGPIESLTDYNRIRSGMFWLRV